MNITREPKRNFHPSVVQNSGQIRDVTTALGPKTLSYQKEKDQTMTVTNHKKEFSGNWEKRST